MRQVGEVITAGGQPDPLLGEWSGVASTVIVVLRELTGIVRPTDTPALKLLGPQQVLLQLVKHPGCCLHQSFILCTRFKCVVKLYLGER